MLTHLVDLVLPLECGACRSPGSRWCASCAVALASTGFPGGPRLAAPRPCPPGLPPTYAWGAYAGPLRPALTAWKDEGRADLDRILRPLLDRALAAAITASGGVDEPVLVVPVPSSARSRRRRGEVPLERLLSSVVRGASAGESGRPRRDAPRAATGGSRLGSGALVQGRPVSDQATLGTAARAANLHRALRVARRFQPVVHGRRCVVVDDVMTTGATLRECARALLEAGAQDVVAATIAVTARQNGAPARPSRDRLAASRGSLPTGPAAK